MRKPTFKKARAARVAVSMILCALGVEGQQLTLDEAVQIAVHHNLDIANTALDVSK